MWKGSVLYVTHSFSGWAQIKGIYGQEWSFKGGKPSGHANLQALGLLLEKWVATRLLWDEYTLVVACKIYSA